MRWICNGRSLMLALGICAALGPGDCLVSPAQTGPPGTGIRVLSTTRITQVTGGYDPEDKRCLNDTPSWRVAGTDLGANTEHNGRLYFFFGDVVPTPGGSWPPYDSDLIAFTEDRSPEPNGFRLIPVMRDGAFYPFTVRVPGGPASGIQLLRDDTPTGAFSYGGKVYVFFAWHDLAKSGHPFHSSLASSEDPSKPLPFEWVADIPPKFSQVAPWVVTNVAAVRGLPASQGEGLVLFGQGATADGRGAVYLGWVPLHSGRAPDLSEIVYYTNSLDPARRWTKKESEATPLFKTKWSWSSLSVGRIPGTGKWILLYQRTTRPQATEESIVARIAAAPTEFVDETEAGEIAIFTPVKHGGYRLVAEDGTVVNRGFMHRERGQVADGLDRLPPAIGGNGFAYGAYLLNRYTRWDDATRTLTVYYLMSTAMPYQVQLMRSEIRIPAG